jgi:hypothetical protein
VAGAARSTEVDDVLVLADGVDRVSVDPIFDETEAGITALPSEPATPISTDDEDDESEPPPAGDELA